VSRISYIFLAARWHSRLFFYWYFNICAPFFFIIYLSRGKTL
jgi:hypothetical protein